MHLFPLQGYSAPAARDYALSLAANPELERKRDGALQGATVELRGYRTYFHALHLVNCTIKGDLEKPHLRGCSILRSTFSFLL